MSERILGITYMGEMTKKEFYDTFEKIVLSVRADGDPVFSGEKLCTDEMKERFFILTEYMENAPLNVTAIKGEGNIISRHYADSLSVSELIPAGSSVIDVGTGGGFPALPLAIAREDLRITALDSTAKKIDYVRSAAEKLGLVNVIGVCGRAEELCSVQDGSLTERKIGKIEKPEKNGKSKNRRDAKAPENADVLENPAPSGESMRENYDVCVSRAVAALPVLCELCLPFVKVGGYFLALKGAAAECEINEAKDAVRKLGGETIRDITVEIDSLGETLSHHIIMIEKIGNTPKNYPRAFAKINKNPL